MLPLRATRVPWWGDRARRVLACHTVPLDRRSATTNARRQWDATTPTLPNLVPVLSSSLPRRILLGQPLWHPHERLRELATTVNRRTG